MFDQTFDQFSKEIWICAVQVATVWTIPNSAREIDILGVKNPTDIGKWVEMLDFESKLALSDENRVQTQLLYGEQVVITQVKDDWAQVVVPNQPSKKDMRGYPGWVPLQQLMQVAKKDWLTILTATVTDNFALLESEDRDPLLTVSFLTQLPIKWIHRDRIEVITPHGNLFVQKDAVQFFTSSHGIEKKDGVDIVQAGERFLGLEYFWGGMSAFGYDCSGLAYSVHKACGYLIPRDASEQAELGQKIRFEELMPGDLIFFRYEEGLGKLHHVGIYHGNGKMLHAPKTGKGIEIIELENSVYEKELCAARRYW